MCGVCVCVCGVCVCVCMWCVCVCVCVDISEVEAASVAGPRLSGAYFIPPCYHHRLLCVCVCVYVCAREDEINCMINDGSVIMCWT